MCVWRFSEQNRIPFSIAMKFINDRGLEDLCVSIYGHLICCNISWLYGFIATFYLFHQCIEE